MSELDLSKYRPNREFLLYKSPNGDVKVDVLLQNETIWMPQKRIAELFDVNVPAISKHLKNIFESRELNEKVVVSILEITTMHGAIEGKTQNKKTKFYNLDAIIAVGYRVNSKYLDYAEDQAEQGNVMTMKNWAEKLNAFLQFNQKDILQNAGKVTTAIAKSFAESEFEKYKPIQDKLFESDFDREMKKLLKDDTENT